VRKFQLRAIHYEIIGRYCIKRQSGEASFLSHEFRVVIGGDRRFQTMPVILHQLLD